MHVSGNVLRDALKDSLHEHLNVIYLRPSNFVEPDQPLGAA